MGVSAGTPRRPARPASEDARRRIPSVDQLVNELEPEGGELPRALVVQVVRSTLDDIRRRARRSSSSPSTEEVRDLVRAQLAAALLRELRPVINATGVLLHTNLGRAPLSDRALQSVLEVARGYSSLELDLQSGRRGGRQSHVEPLIASATGAEQALVVNNCAAAVLLACAVLAPGREVVISRGELIEIGGEFRIPDVIEASGARLREVGTTNRTHPSDYEKAITDQTGLVMKVHPSNYRVVGFTATASLEQIAAVARRKRVPLLFDAGSGLLGSPVGDEPVVADALRQGADLVCFSGDTLLGGPQAGVIAGSGRLVQRMRRHPLVRALRPDKMTIAALQATIRAHLSGRRDELPLWRMIGLSASELRTRTDALAVRAQEAGFKAAPVQGESLVGAGSLPGHGLPTVVVRLSLKGVNAATLAARLRSHEPPVIVRVEGGSVVVDLRTVADHEVATLARALEWAAGLRG